MSRRHKDSDFSEAQKGTLHYKTGWPYGSEAFHVIAEQSLSGILVLDRDRIHYANSAFEKITGYNQEDIKEMSPWDMVHPDERDNIRAIGIKRLRKADVTDYYETRWLHKKGHEIWVEVRASLLERKDELQILANIIDITKRKMAQNEIIKREKELEIQSHRLNETNMALKVILRQQNEEKEKIQQNIEFNVNKLIMPYIEQLESLKLSSRHTAYVQSIKENLKEIIAPHVRTLSTRYAKLTPRQLEVVNFVRQGKTSKEIAEILCISKDAVDFHRHNIRRNLELTKKKVNLRSFLDLLEKDK